MRSTLVRWCERTEAARPPPTRLIGRAHDCGNKLGYAKAFAEFAMRDKVLGEEFSAHIQSLNDIYFVASLNTIEV